MYAHLCSSKVIKKYIFQVNIYKHLYLLLKTIEPDYTII